MAKCPVCDHDVATPFFYNLEAWSQLACPQCKARLEMKPPRSGALAILMGPAIVLARQGRVFEVLAVVFLVVTALLVLLESMRPRVRLRLKRLPKPGISLMIDGPSN